MKFLLFFNILTIAKFIFLLFITKNLFYVIKLKFRKTISILFKNCKNICIDTVKLKKYKLLKKLNTSYTLSQNEAVVCSSFCHW